VSYRLQVFAYTAYTLWTALARYYPSVLHQRDVKLTICVCTCIGMHRFTW
jgi:hypothetical protein